MYQPPYYKTPMSFIRQLLSKQKKESVESYSIFKTLQEEQRISIEVSIPKELLVPKYLAEN